MLITFRFFIEPDLRAVRKGSKTNVMKLLAGLMLLFIGNGLSAQVDSVQTQLGDTLKSQKDTILKITTVHFSGFSGYDKIKLQSGDSIIVNIIAETQTEVAFKYPMNTMINKVLFSKIKEINYSDGKIKAFNNQQPVVGAEPDNLWRIVEITSDEAAVNGLKEIGPITAKAEGRSLKTSIDLLEKNARVNLQKKAVRMNATMVLVKTKNIEQAYGEIPIVEFEGIAYGVE